MSKYDLMKNVAKKNSAKTTADSSKSVSKPQTQTTKAPAKTSTRKSEATYWQDSQQTSNKQATKSVQKQMNISQPAKKTLSPSEKRRAQADATIARNKYKADTKKAQTYNPNEQADYSQFNEGFKNIFSKGGASSAMRKYADANRKALDTERYRRLGQAEKAQAVIDRDRADIASNRDVKAWSDTGLSMLGGLTNWVGGALRTVPNYLRADAGYTGNKKLQESLAQFDRDLGLEEMQQNVNEGNIVADNLMGKAASSIGNMLPTVATNLVTGGIMGLDPKIVEALGLGTMGISGLGNSTAQAFNNLQADGDLSQADTTRALGYGLGSTALELATEKMSSFIPGLETFAFTNPNNLLGQAGGEALEEMASSVVEPWLNPLANPNLTNDNFGAQYARDVNAYAWSPEHFKDIAESGLLGAATSLAMGAPANIQNIPQVIEQIRQSNAENGTITPEQRMIVERFVTALQEAGLDEYANSFRALLGEEGYTPRTQNIPLEKRLSQLLNTAENPVPGQAEPTTQILRRSDERSVAPEYKPNQYTPRASEAREVINPADYTASPEAEGATTATETFDRDLGELMEETMNNTEDMSLAEQRATERQLTKRQQNDVAEEYRTDSSTEPVKATLQPPTENTVPEDYQAQDKDEEVIYEGEYKTKIRDAVIAGNPEQIKAAGESLTTAMSEETGVPVSPELTDAADEIVNDINEAHQVLAEIPKNETTPGRFKESKAKATTEQLLRDQGNDVEADRLANDPDRGNYKTISRDEALRSAQAVFDDVGLDGLRSIIIRPELIQNKGVSGMMIDYCAKYTQEATARRDSFMADNKLSYGKDGAVLQDGKAVSEDSQVYKDLQKMNEEDQEVIDAAIQYRSNAGYALNACRLMNELSPVFRMTKIEQWITKLNNELHSNAKGRSNASISPLTEAEKSAFLNAKTDQERSDAIKAIENRVTSELPTSASEVMSQWRYLMMLANPATHVRNIVGNTLMQGLVSAKNAITYGVERLFYQHRRFTPLYDTSNTADVDLMNYLGKVPFDNINKMFDEYLTKGLNDKPKSERREFWKNKGFSGETLEYLAKGKNAAVDGLTKRRWSNSMTNMAKQAGYTISDTGGLVDSSGNAVSNEALMDIMQKGYEDSRRHYVHDSQFSRTNQEGKAVFTNKLSDKALYDYADSQFRAIADAKSQRDAGKWNANGVQQASKVFEKTRSEFINKTLGKGLDWLASKNDTALNEEDAFFTGRRFRNEYATQLKLNGYEVKDGVLMKDGKEVDLESKEVLRMQEYAYEEALESVFRDVNWLARKLNEMRAQSKIAKFAIDATLPFTTTPFNITRRVFEYSPIGLMQGLYGTVSGVKNGKMSPQTAINKLARGTTGTGLMALGAFLASIGALAGKGDDKDRAGRYEASLGMSPEYALTFPDGSSYTIDFAAPSGAILLLGATMYDRLNALQMKEGDDLTHSAQTVLDWMTGSMATALDPVLDMTVLSSLQDLLGNDDAESLGLSVVKNFTGQFTPSVGGKLNKIIDNTKRTTYSDTWIDQILRQNMNKIPMMSTLLEPALDYHGDEISNTVYDTGNDVANKAIDAAYYMLSPGNYQQNKATDYDKELLSVARQTGNNYIVPTQFTYLTNENKEKFKFTPKERTELNQYYAQTYKKEVEKFMNSDSYGVYDQYGKEGVQQKSEIMDAIQKHVYNMTKEKYFSKVTPDSESVLWKSDVAAEKMKGMGMDYYQFYQLKAVEPNKDSEGNTIPQSGAINVRVYLENQGLYDTVKKAIADGKLKVGDVGLTKTVLKWDEDTFDAQYQELQDNLANSEYTVGKKGDKSNGDKSKDSKSAGSGSGGKSSSYTSSTKTRTTSRASGGSSSSSTFDPYKVALTYFNQAMKKSQRTASDISSEASGYTSPQDLYNRLMSSHNTRLREASKYTKA